jgi:hypothetical protein
MSDGEWWSYGLEDFLLFSPRVYWRMLEVHNAALWPLHIPALAVGIAALTRAFRQAHGRWIMLLLAAGWAFVGWAFLWNRYATINWAVAYVAPAFVLQALLMLVSAISGGLVFDRRGVAGWAGLALAATGIAVYPVLPPLFGRPWSGAELFGIASDPTAIATLGLLLAGRARLLPMLVPIPLAWCVLGGLTLLAMGDAQAWLPLGAAAVAAVAALLQLVRTCRGRGLPRE